MSYSIEMLTHFCCDSCECWWTVAYHYFKQNVSEKWYCPHCGHERLTAQVAQDQIAVLQEVIAVLQQRV